MNAKVNTTMHGTSNFENRLSDFREFIDHHLDNLYGNGLQAASIEVAPHVEDGGFLILKGDEPLNATQFINLTQWIDRMARIPRRGGFGGAYALSHISYRDTGVIVIRVYDR